MTHAHFPRIGLIALALAAPQAVLAQAAPATAQAAPVPNGPGSLSGLWTNAQYKFTGGLSARQRAIQAYEGQNGTGSPPPLLPEARKVLDDRLDAADKQDKIFANTLSECLPGGVPMMLFGAAYPIQILETGNQITMLFEEQNHFRIIRLGGTHPGEADLDPSYMGDSIGHWEGDTLVVDTVGLNDKTTLDMVGTPHSEALHVTERYRRIAADMLDVTVTIDDPKTFSKPWQAHTQWRLGKPGSQVHEYICENNRNGSDANGFQTFGAPGHNR
jgi:hypothetical protein